MTGLETIRKIMKSLPMPIVVSFVISVAITTRSIIVDVMVMHLKNCK